MKLHTLFPVVPKGTCKLCGHAVETTYHALVECEHAKQFWSATLDYFGFRIPRVHPVTWMKDLLVDSVLQEEHIPIAVL
jgi:hypothetical protein